MFLNPTISRTSDAIGPSFLRTVKSRTSLNSASCLYIQAVTNRHHIISHSFRRSSSSPQQCRRNRSFRSTPLSRTQSPTTQRYVQSPPSYHESCHHSDLSNLISAEQTLSNLHSLTASLFGVGAGILGLESYYGFLFYIAFSIATSLLFYILQIAPSSLGEGRSVLDSGRYYRGALELWTSGIFNGLPGFILTWTLFYGLVRA